MKHAGTFRLGDTVGPYQIQDLIGVGFMGEVYRALHRGTSEVFALKCLQVRHVDNPDLVERSRREAVALTQIRHANIVYVHEAGVTDSGVVWMAMELLVGRSLRRVMKEQGRLPVPMALHYACEIADGVDAAHEFSIVHRDLKPENVFVTERNELRVLDLGTAKFFGQDMETTGRAQVFGTVPYMSPEHLAGERVDARTDVYALGMMLYEMLAGVHPFKAQFESILELGRAQMFQMPKPLFEVVDGLPGYLWPIVEKAVAKDREQRYVAMSEFARTLRRVRKRFEEERRHAGDDDGSFDRTLPRVLSTRKDYMPPQAPPRSSDPGRPGSPGSEHGATRPLGPQDSLSTWERGGDGAGPGRSGGLNGGPPGGFVSPKKTLRLESRDAGSRTSSPPAEHPGSHSGSDSSGRIGPFGTQVIPSDLRDAIVARAARAASSASSSGQGRTPQPGPAGPLPPASATPRPSAPWRSEERSLHDGTEVRTDDGVGIPMRAALEVPRQTRLLALFVSLCAALAVGLGALMWVRSQRSPSAQTTPAEEKPVTEQASGASAVIPPSSPPAQEVPVLDPAKEEVLVLDPAKEEAPVAAPAKEEAPPSPAPPAAAPPSEAQATAPKPKPTGAPAVPFSESAQGSGGKLIKKSALKPAPTSAPAQPKDAPLFDF